MKNSAFLVKNIRKLVQVESEPELFRAGKTMQQLNCMDDAFLLTDGEIIIDFGKMSDWKEEKLSNLKGKVEVIDATGKMVFPTFCDSHTHIVYAGSREIEYIDKIKGLSYEEIAERGGGILNSTTRLHDTSEEQLFEDAMARLDEIKSYGTGAVEINSGYGLN